MLCLHGEKCYATSTVKNGTFWYCKNRNSPCHFICSEDQADLYDKAVKEFLATKQARPKCCAVKIPEQRTMRTLVNDGGNVEIPEVAVVRNYAKMKVVTDMEKESFGRPFFVCSKKNERCDYFAWGDQIIVERPLCEHGKPSRLLTVKKEGPNKDQKFFGCAEQKENRCDFFEWFREEAEDPLLPGSIVLFSNPPSYKYTVKKTGAMFTSGEKDRKKAYAEFLRSGKKYDAPDIHQEMHKQFLGAQRSHSPETTADTDLFGRPFIPLEKRKWEKKGLTTYACPREEASKRIRQ